MLLRPSIAPASWKRPYDSTPQAIADAVVAAQTAEKAPEAVDTARVLDSMSKFSDMSHLTASIEAANKGLGGFLVGYVY